MDQIKGSTVISCLGWLTKPDAFPADDEKKSLLPSGVALVDHLEEGDRRFSREQRPMVNVALEKGTVVLSLQLTSLSIRDALIRYSPGIFTSAALADAIHVFVWNL